MKLPLPTLTPDQRLAEFDHWITPSLAEVRDSARFASELDRVAAVFDRMAAATEDFASVDACAPAAIAETYLSLVDADPNRVALLHDLASTLFMVTGKSDNNAKCQLPLFLRDHAGIGAFPDLRRRRVGVAELPRVLKSDRLMKAVGDHRVDRGKRLALLNAFVAYVLSDTAYTRQLWSIGQSYVAMRGQGCERALLSPLITFQVRGSVAASGGHAPEDLLRRHMTDWGLQAEVDFNTSDVIVVSGGDGKTRAYDFVLPYRVPGCPSRLYVQCQFYAGDSGSVSHKNVDQTRSSRDSISPYLASEGLPPARFIEYVDGAGYFSSLNRDLRSLLSFADTAALLQIRSAPVRLRRELQHADVLAPLEVAHLVVGGAQTEPALRAVLSRDGYSEPAIARGLARARATGFAAPARKGTWTVGAEFLPLARRLLLLDLAVIHGGELPEPEGDHHLYVPGHGAFWGLPVDDVLEQAQAWSATDIPRETLREDVGWLVDRGYARLG